MLFIPIALLMFLGFALFLPVLFVLGYFNIITIGFEKLGISPGVTVFLLLAILIGSAVNIPITKKRLVYTERPRFFGLFRTPKIEVEGTAINLGGAIIPVLISLYFLFLNWRLGFDLEPIFISIVLMIIVSKLLAKIVPGRGISLPAITPPIFSAIFAMALAPEFAASCAFIAGTLGVLIGADILNLRRIQRYGGFLSIGGAGVFDGIFLVGIVSALLSAF